MICDSEICLARKNTEVSIALLKGTADNLESRGVAGRCWQSLPKTAALENLQSA